MTEKWQVRDTRPRRAHPTQGTCSGGTVIRRGLTRKQAEAYAARDFKWVAEPQPS